MKNLYILLIGLFFFVSVNGQQTVAICKEKYGCDIAKINLSRVEIDNILGKKFFLTAAGKNAILVLNNCNSAIDEKKSTLQLHQTFGGKASPKTLGAFDLRKYLLEKGCLKTCPNNTKKISFKVTSPDHSGSGYFFANLKAGEAFMPNEAFQQFYAGQDMASMKVDAFFRNFKYISYMVDPDGGKFVTDMPIGTSMAGIGSDLKNEARFKKDFKPTGRKRQHLATKDFQYEYVGKGDDGQITFWLGPAYDVCLPAGKFDALGFWNLGFISVDGKTYLLAEISGSGFKVTVTAVADGSYSFNTAGYQSISGMIK